MTFPIDDINSGLKGKPIIPVSKSGDKKVQNKDIKASGTGQINNVTGIKTADDIQKIYSPEQLEADFYRGDLILTSYGGKAMGEPYTQSYAEYTLAPDNKIDRSFINEGNKVRKVINIDDPLYLFLNALSNDPNLPQPQEYNESTFDAISKKVCSNLKDTQELIILNREQRLKYAGATDKYLDIMDDLKKNDFTLTEYMVLKLDECCQAYQTLYDELFKTDINAGRLKKFEDLVNANAPFSNNGEKIKKCMQVMNYIMQLISNIDTVSCKTVFEIFAKRSGYDYGPVMEEQFLKNLDLLRRGSLKYVNSNAHESGSIVVARDLKFKCGIHELSGYLICSDKSQADKLLGKLNINKDDAHATLSSTGFINLEMVSPKVLRNDEYLKVVKNIEKGTKIKTSGKTENDRVIKIVRDYVVLKEIGIDPLDLQKRIKQINGSIKAVLDEKSRIQDSALKINVKDEDFNILAKLMVQLGYIKDSSSATKKDIINALIKFIFDKGRLDLLDKDSQHELTAQAEDALSGKSTKNALSNINITVKEDLINALLNTCAEENTYTYVSEDKKVYIRGKKEKILVPIENYRQQDAVSGYDESTIKISYDGRDLMWKNPTFVFKLYMYEYAKTERPIIDGKYKQVITAEEVEALIKFKQLSENADIFDVSLLSELAAYIKSKKIVVKNIYENVPIYEGKEEMCEKVNKALNVIRDFYEYTIFRNIEIVNDEEQQMISEQREQGVVTKLGKTKSFVINLIKQLVTMPSFPMAKTADMVTDDTVLALKETMFAGYKFKDEEEKIKYLTDPNIDAKFIVEFVKKYPGLLSTPTLVYLTGMSGEKLKDPAGYLLSVAGLMQGLSEAKNEQSFSLHFTRNVSRKEYQKAKVILQTAVQMYMPGLKNVNWASKELNGFKILKDNLINGITAFPFALSLKGALLKNGGIKFGDASLQDNKVNGKVISAAGKSFRAVINDIKSSSAPDKADVIKYVDATKLSLKGKTDEEKLADLEKYCKILESYQGKNIEFDFTYKNYPSGIKSDLIDALKVYTRTIVPIFGGGDISAENQMNIAISTKKLIGWKNKTVTVENVDKVTSKDVIVTSVKVSQGEKKNIFENAYDAVATTFQQVVLFKFIMEPMIQLQMMLGSGTVTEKITYASAHGDPYASQDMEDATKSFAKTRANFVAYMLPFAWANQIFDYIGQGSIVTAAAVLFVTRGFLLRSAGYLFNVAGNVVNRAVFRTGKVNMGPVSERTFTFSEDKEVKEELKTVYEEKTKDITIKKKVNGKEIIEFKSWELRGFKDIQLKNMGTLANVEFRLRSGIASLIRYGKFAPKLLIDPVGIFELATGGAISKAERFVGKPLKKAASFVLKIFTKRGDVNPKYQIEEPTLQETIVSAIKNPEKEFKFTFKHNNWLNDRLAEPSMKAYKWVGKTKPGGYVFGQMQLSMQEMGTAKVTLRGWQIAQILSSEKSTGVIDVLGIKLKEREESVLLSNLKQSADIVMDQPNVIRFLNRQFGWDMKESDYDLSTKNGVAKLADEIGSKVNGIAKAGERIQNAENLEFKRIYKFAAENPLREIPIDIGLNQYGLKLKVTGEEICTLYKLFNAPFQIDLSMGANLGPKSIKTYNKIIESIMRRNPWLKKFYMNDIVTDSELFIFNQLDHVIQELSKNTGRSTASIEVSFRLVDPLRYKIYEKVKNYTRYQALKATADDRSGWSKEDLKIYNDNLALEKFYQVESDFLMNRVIEVSKNAKPIMEGLPVNLGDANITETADTYIIRDKMYNKSEVNELVYGDDKGYIKAHRSYIEGLKPDEKSLYKSGSDVSSSSRMTDINSIITDPLLSKFYRAYPRAIILSIFVANPNKHIVNLRYDKMKSQLKIQPSMEKRYALKTAKENMAKSPAETKEPIPEDLPMAAKPRLILPGQENAQGPKKIIMPGDLPPTTKIGGGLPYEATADQLFNERIFWNRHVARENAETTGVGKKYFNQAYDQFDVDKIKVNQDLQIRVNDKALKGKITSIIKTRGGMYGFFTVAGLVEPIIINLRELKSGVQSGKVTALNIGGSAVITVGSIAAFDIGTTLGLRALTKMGAAEAAWFFGTKALPIIGWALFAIQLIDMIDRLVTTGKLVNVSMEDLMGISIRDTFTQQVTKKADPKGYKYFDLNDISAPPTAGEMSAAVLLCRLGWMEAPKDKYDWDVQQYELKTPKGNISDFDLETILKGIYFKRCDIAQKSMNFSFAQVFYSRARGPKEFKQASKEYEKAQYELLKSFADDPAMFRDMLKVAMIKFREYHGYKPFDGNDGHITKEDCMALMLAEQDRTK